MTDGPFRTGAHSIQNVWFDPEGGEKTGVHVCLATVPEWADRIVAALNASVAGPESELRERIAEKNATIERLTNALDPEHHKDVREAAAAALEQHEWDGGDHSNHPLADFVDVVTKKLGPYFAWERDTKQQYVAERNQFERERDLLLWLHAEKQWDHEQACAVVEMLTEELEYIRWLYAEAVWQRDNAREEVEEFNDLSNRDQAEVSRLHAELAVLRVNLKNALGVQPDGNDGDIVRAARRLDAKGVALPPDMPERIVEAITGAINCGLSVRQELKDLLRAWSEPRPPVTEATGLTGKLADVALRGAIRCADMDGVDYQACYPARQELYREYAMAVLHSLPMPILGQLATETGGEP